MKKDGGDGVVVLSVYFLNDLLKKTKKKAL